MRETTPGTIIEPRADGVANGGKQHVTLCAYGLTRTNAKNAADRREGRSTTQVASMRRPPHERAPPRHPPHQCQDGQLTDGVGQRPSNSKSSTTARPGPMPKGGARQDQCRVLRKIVGGAIRSNRRIDEHGREARPAPVTQDATREGTSILRCYAPCTVAVVLGL